jgi:hypothetical protein
MQAALLATQRSRARREQSRESSAGEELRQIDRKTSDVSSSLSMSSSPVFSSSSAIAVAFKEQQDYSPTRKVSLGFQSQIPNNGGEQVQLEEDASSLAVLMLDASSQTLRRIVGQHLSQILVGAEEGLITAEEVTPKASRNDLDALIQLAKSPNKQLKKAACELIAKHSDLFPRGKLGVKFVLQKTSLVLELGTKLNDTKATAFALEIGKAIAQEGETWAKRMVDEEAWDDKLSNLIATLEDPGLLLTALQVCTQLSQCSSAAKYLDGCVKCIQDFPQNSDLIREACTVLSKNLPPIEDDSILLLFLSTAADAANEGDFNLVCDALKVVRAKSQLQAQKLAQLFEESEAMNTLNTLYRSQTFGSKLECALFIEALVHELGSDVAAKVRLCESAIIVRLIRLASPSAGTNDDGHELAYLPAISALTELAEIERVGARIVLAGGLGPLFTHANSNRNTRTQAKKALNALVCFSKMCDTKNWGILTSIGIILIGCHKLGFSC